MRYAAIIAVIIASASPVIADDACDRISSSIKGLAAVQSILLNVITEIEVGELPEDQAARNAILVGAAQSAEISGAEFIRRIELVCGPISQLQQEPRSE